MYTGGVPPKMPARTQPTVPNQPSGGSHGGLPMPGMGLGGVLNPLGGGGNPASSVDIEKETKKKEMSSLLWESANKNDINGVKQAMAETGDPNICDLQGVSALLLAVKNKNPAMINLLLSAKANPNSVSQDNSPIHEAVRQHNPQLMEQLLNAGGDVNLKADFGKTPLHVAIQEDQWNIVDILLRKKADINQTNDAGASCLHFAAAITTGSAASKEGFEKLLALKLPVDAINKNGKTPLHVASEKGNTDAIKLLLMANASTTILDGWGRTPKECGKTTAFKLISSHKPGMKYEFVDLIALEKEEAKK